jgi:hypothetical protein
MISKCLAFPISKQISFSFIIISFEAKKKLVSVVLRPNFPSRYSGEAPTNFMPNYGGVRMMSKLQYHHHHPAAAAEEAVNLMQKHKEAATSAVYHFPMQYFPTHTYTPLYFNSAMPHQFSLQQPSAVPQQTQQQQPQPPPPQQQQMPPQQQPQRPPMAFNFSNKAGQSLLIQDTRPLPPHPHPPPPAPQQAPVPRTPPHPHPPMHQQVNFHLIYYRPRCILFICSI